MPVNLANISRASTLWILLTVISVSLITLPTTSALRFRGHFNRTGDVCIYLDTIISVTITARKGQEEFVRTFNDGEIIVLAHQCENEPVEGVAYIRLGIPDFAHSNSTGGGVFRYIYSSPESDQVVLDRSVVIKPSAIFAGLDKPADLVMFRDPKTLHMGDQGSSYLCRQDRSAEFTPGETRDGYRYSLRVDRSYFQTQAFNIQHSKLGPSVRCHSHSKPDDTALIISCVVGGVVVVAIVAAVISMARHRKNYSSIL